MKTILSSRRHHYVVRVSIFLLTVALIAGMVGCGQVGAYGLTIYSTPGGTVTTPGVGTFYYVPGTVVNLVATPGAGYVFVNWTGNVGTIANVNATATTITMSSAYGIVANFAPFVVQPQYNIPMVSADGWHTVGLSTNGTVVAVGYNTFGQCNVSGWSGTGIVQVAAGDMHTVGRRSDGTVVAVGLNDWGQCNVGGWTNIIQVAAGWSFTVGRSGWAFMFAVGGNTYGQWNGGGG